MKLAPTQKKIGDFFIMQGWAIVLIVLVTYAAFYWGITAVDSIKNYEKIDYFIESYGLKENTLSKDTIALLKDKGVLESNVYNVSPASSIKSQKFDKFGAYSDIVIFNYQDMVDMEPVIADNFMVLSADFKAKYASGLSKTYSYYTAETGDYGLKIYDPADSVYSAQFHYSDLITFTQEGAEDLAYYICIPIRSVNYGKTTSNGFTALNNFLKTYEGAS